MIKAIIFDCFGVLITQGTDGSEVKNTALLAHIADDLRPTYKVAMLSNVSTAGLGSRFKSDELKKHFDAVVVSGEIGYAKPEPEAYEITADRLDVRLDECIMIDDREDYCEGARRVGMQSILYRSNVTLLEVMKNIPS